MNNRAAAIRARLQHPVIDGDGHWLEPVPVFLKYLRAVGGAPSGRSRARALVARSYLVPLASSGVCAQE